MAEGKDPMTRGNGGDRSHQIEADIDRSRAAIDRTVDAIAGKLTPQQLMMEAAGVFKDGSATLAHKVITTAREHPVPATIIGIGLGLLISESGKSSSRPRSTGPTGPGYAPNSNRFTGGYQAGYQAGFQTYGSQGGYEASQPSSYGVRDAVSDAGTVASHAVHRVEDMASNAGHRMADAASNATERVADMAGSVAAQAGDVTQRVKQQAAEVGNEVRDRASHLAEQVRNQAGHVGDQVRGQADHLRERADHLRQQVPMRAREQWHDTQLSFWRTMDSSPLAMGAAAIAIGVVAGLSVPSTRKERELMGETRDHLMDQAQEIGRDALDKGKQVARVAADVVKSEVERQGLTPGDLVQKVVEVGKQAQQAVVSEADKAMPDALKKDAPTGTSSLGTTGASRIV